jgi:hypothetical protein
MKVMVLIKADRNTEVGVLPNPQGFRRRTQGRPWPVQSHGRPNLRVVAVAGPVDGHRVGEALP